MTVEFPGPQDRTLVCGRTGSGKTTFAEWLLSGHNFDTQPALILNTKADPSINEIAALGTGENGIHLIGVDDTPGDRGLYIVTPRPHERDEVDDMLMRVWEKQNCLVFVDEVYMLGLNPKGFNACLTQGRTRNIPMIICTQRPAWCSGFVFTESDYVALFNLQRRADRIKIGEVVPVDKNYRLPPYHSYWYTVKPDKLVTFSPVPNKPAILDVFRAKFPPEPAQEGEPPVFGASPAITRAPGKRVV